MTVLNAIDCLSVNSSSRSEFALRQLVLNSQRLDGLGDFCSCLCVHGYCLSIGCLHCTMFGAEKQPLLNCCLWPTKWCSVDIGFIQLRRTLLHVRLDGGLDDCRLADLVLSSRRRNLLLHVCREAESDEWVLGRGCLCLAHVFIFLCVLILLLHYTTLSNLFQPPRARLSRALLLDG